MSVFGEELIAHIAGARSQVDELWSALEDAVLPDDQRCNTQESNRDGGRQAAYQLLQCLRAAERALEVMGDDEDYDPDFPPLDPPPLQLVGRHMDDA